VTERLVVGTRRSPLARAQTELVVRALARRRRGVRFEVRALETSGDRNLREGLSPDFTDTIDRALRDGEVDLAVHSAKDLPLESPAGLSLAACPRRADPRDGLVVRGRRGATTLPRGARVGSSSLRRRAQLLRWRPDLSIVEMRGNVDSRLRRVQVGEVDAAVLAVAGLKRLGRSREITTLLPLAEFLPAPGQGALAVVVRTGDRRPAEVARTIDDRSTHAAVAAEREFAAALGGDCRVPLAALARVRQARIELDGEVLSPDGKVRLRVHGGGPVSAAPRVGQQLARTVLDQGGGSLLEPLRG
jgi:hydroxymethylbilane synthase